MDRNNLIAMGIVAATLCFGIFLISKEASEEREFRYVAAQNGVPVVVCVK